MSGSSELNPPKVIRTDIQALRTIAVLLVVIFHLWPYNLPGGFIGVDIFFVISGFLITSHLIRDVDRGNFNVTTFWGRRIKRLLPASFLVLLVTAAAIAIWAPFSQWGQWLGEVIASVFYFENWNLAAASVDYLALENQASPVQHFWSLSTEEQFYFVWPLLIAVVLYLLKRNSLKEIKSRDVIFVVLAVVTAASFTFGVLYTYSEPAIAYFSTPVRAWEFGVGALIAFAPAMRLNKFKPALALVGIATLLAASFVINTATPFPGASALLPVLGTAAVIFAAVESGWLSKILGFKPIQWIGDRSYAIYLWHWPILIIAPWVTTEVLDGIGKLVVLALTFMLSWLSYKFVERPINGTLFTKWKIFATAAATSVVIAGSSALIIYSGSQLLAQQVAQGKTDEAVSDPCFGAHARQPGNEFCANKTIEGDPLDHLVPSLKVAAADNPTLPEDCISITRQHSDATACRLGNRDSKIKIAAIGDSHIGHYAGVLNSLAVKNNWSVDLYSKGGCPFTYAVRAHEPVLTKSCSTWIKNVVAAIPTQQYGTIITSQASGVKWVDGNPSAVTGLTKLWTDLTNAGVRIVSIKDSPIFGKNVVTCLQFNTDCAVSPSVALRFDAQVEAAANVQSVRFVDFDKVFCDPDKCLPIIGNVIVFRDSNHLTDTFARTLGYYLEPHIVRALPNR